MTHSAVHRTVREIIAGSRVRGFYVMATSIEEKPGDVAFEWRISIALGASGPLLDFRGTDATELLEEIRETMTALRPTDPAPPMPEGAA